MSDQSPVKCCGSREPVNGAAAPFTSLHYHYGMLLGVADFETEQSYHRGKTWLHSAWLHREGVVWGYGVNADAARGELRVSRGLAVDALGRELHLEADACLDVVAWFRAHREDAGFEPTVLPDGSVRWDAHIVLRFKTCLSRQVPALAESCENAGTATAYSRSVESVEILLRPGLAPERPVPYRRLRLFHGVLEPRPDPGGAGPLPEDLAVLNAPRTLDQLRLLAALDEIDLAPPSADVREFPVPLANVRNLALAKEGDGFRFTGAEVDVGIRPSHVATSTQQELLAGPLNPAAGPRVLTGSVAVSAASVVFSADRALAPASVAAAAFELAAFDPAAGWAAVPLGAPALSDGDRTVTLPVSGPLPAGGLVRFTARGSGSAALLGADLSAFNHGRDFVHDHRN